MRKLCNLIQRTKIGLGCSPINNEAKKFITDYRNVLDKLQKDVDEFLASRQDSSLVDTVKESKSFIDDISINQEKLNLPDLYMPCHAMIYLLCRKANAAKIIETGVEKGGSTYMILSALDKNNKGHLHSIDIGKYYVYKTIIQSHIGPLVTKSLKDRWTFVLGNAQKVLEDILENKTGMVNIFMALQGHTYKVQRHECELAWPRIVSGGILVLDRPDWNNGKYQKEFLDKYRDEILYYDTFKEGNHSDSFEFSVFIKK